MKELEQMTAIQRVLNGETEAFTLLVSHFQGSVLRTAAAITGDNISAQDLAQESFVAAFQNLSKYDAHRATFSTWLYSIVRNRSRNFLRNKKKTQHSSEYDHLASTANGPLGNLKWKEQFEALDKALNELPESWRRAFCLTEIDGVSYADAAMMEGIPIGTIRSRVHRSRHSLAKTLNNPFKPTE